MGKPKWTLADFSWHNLINHLAKKQSDLKDFFFQNAHYKMPITK